MHVMMPCMICRLSPVHTVSHNNLELLLSGKEVEFHFHEAVDHRQSTCPMASIKVTPIILEEVTIVEVGLGIVWDCHKC